MKKPLLFILAAVWMLPAPAAEVPDIAGIVVDGDGKSVRKAEVFLYYSDGEQGVYSHTAGKARTDGKGRFVFKQALEWPDHPPLQPHYKPRPNYGLVAYHRKHGMNFAILHQDDKTDAVRITLRRLFSQTATVTDADGRPVPDAKVYIASMQVWEQDAKDLPREHHYLGLHEDIGLPSGVTGIDGKVELQVPYKAGIRAEKAGYTQGYAAGFRLTLQQSARVTGTATYPDGKPAPNVIIRYLYQGVDAYFDRYGLTDAEGRYNLENVAAKGYFSDPKKRQQEAEGPGWSTVMAAMADPESPFVADNIRLLVSPGETKTQDVTFRRGCLFGGQVIDETTGKPAARVRLMLYFDTAGSMLETKVATTDGDGRFKAVVPPDAHFGTQWEDSREGDYIIDKEWLMRNNRWQPFSGQLKQDKTDFAFRLKLWSVQPLRGKVVDAEGRPAAKVRVYIHPDVNRVEASETGEFTIKVAPTDRDFGLLAFSEKRDAAGLVMLPAGATEATITVRPTVTREGIAVTPDGLPATEFEFLFQPKVGPVDLYPLQDRIKTDREGRFKLEQVCPVSDYKIWWFSDNEQNRDYEHGEVIIPSARLASCETIQFQAQRFLNTLMGRVLDPKGNPVPGATVQILSEDMRPSGETKNVTADENGEFEISRLAAGMVKLKAAAPGLKSATVTAPTDAVDTVIKLQPRSADICIEATVVDENGSPVANVPVTLYRGFPAEPEMRIEKTVARTDRAGVARFTTALGTTSETREVRRVLGCDVAGRFLAFGFAPPNEDAESEFILRKSGAPWRGTVVDADGKPLAGAHVRVTTLRRSTGERSFAYITLAGVVDISCKTDSEGRFTLDRISNREGTAVSISAPGFASMNMFLDPAVTEETVARLERAARIVGKAIDKNTGKPVAGIKISIGFEMGTGYLATKEDGSFEIDGVKPGVMTISTVLSTDPKLPYVCTAPVSVETVADQTAEVTVEVEEGIPVSGRLVDQRTGQPFPEGLGVSMSGDRGYLGSLNVSPDGSWKTWLWEGTFRLNVFSQGISMVPLQINVEKGKPCDDILLEAEPAR